MSTDMLLYMLAFFSFILAAIPLSQTKVRFEWFGTAFLVLSLII